MLQIICSDDVLNGLKIPIHEPGIFLLLKTSKLLFFFFNV